MFNLEASLNEEQQRAEEYQCLEATLKEKTAALERMSKDFEEKTAACSQAVNMVNQRDQTIKQNWENIEALEIAKKRLEEYSAEDKTRNEGLIAKLREECTRNLANVEQLQEEL